MSLAMPVLRVLLLLVGSQLAAAATARSTSQMTANPIRRVVTMLQMMQKKVTEEGEKEKELFDKFMCYCKNGAGSLGKSIDAAETKIPQVESDLKASGAEKAQLASDVVQANTDKKAAKSAMAEATAIREKAAASFAKETSEQTADVAAMGKAITSIEKGASGFLQTSAASVLKRLVVSADLTIESRDALTAFLSDGSKDESEDSYEPASGEIVGILKQMKETMAKDIADASTEESASIKDYDALMVAKKRENEALIAEVESKTARLGEVAVSLVNQAQDVADTSKALTEDKKFLGDLDNTCKTKTAEWDVRQKTRSEELTALAETVKLLNDDDALDLFKKTLPGSSSFIQLMVTNKEVLTRVKETLALHIHDYRLDLISMSLQGRKVNFDKVLTMVDDMVALLKKEQVDDDKKKAYCAKEFDKSEDDKKVLTRTEGDLKKTIEDEKESISSLVEEISSLEEGIKALDKAVAQATGNRKEENAAYTESLAANQAALQIIDIAKNRMNKFYNPSLHKAPAKTEADAAAFVEEAPSLVQISAHMQLREAPPPPPETAGAYQKKSGESGGVIAMMDVLIQDLKKENVEMKHDEKSAQTEYEQFMGDSADKRAIDAKSVAEKEAARADTTAKLQKHKEELKGTVAELYANMEYSMALHQECDWLVQNYDVRKNARAGEADALTKAKAVLSGSAD